MDFKTFKEAVKKRFAGYPIEFERNEIEYRAHVYPSVICQGSPYIDTIRMFWHEKYVGSMDACANQVS